MLEGYLVRQPIAVWSTVRGVWETSQVSLLCGHLEPFLETWPISGMTRSGQVFERQTLEHRITGSVFSSSHIPEESMLRTPQANEGLGGALREDEARARGNMVNVRDQVAQLAADNGLKVSDSLLPTVVTTDANGTRNGTASRFGNSAHHSGNTLTDVLLPTVTTQDGKNTGGPSQFERNTKPLNTQVLVGTEWGKFEPAIRRWEKVLDREAPSPTNPDGKDGAHRLSSKFTEWMMGLPDGWVTGVGLSRSDELKACGNGVVPQQAFLALRMLLDGITLERERERR